MVEAKLKITFLEWILSTSIFTRREAYWLLSYLKDHGTILENIQFVENADKTPRGLIFKQASRPEECFYLIKNNNKITNHEKIFHDIRMNWQKPLYIEIELTQVEPDELYYSVLEDNPFYPWNDQIDKKVSERTVQSVLELSHEQVINQLLKEINEALDEGNQELFEKLSITYQKKIHSQNG